MNFYEIGMKETINIIKDVLPETSYSFQHTLSNGKRVDCLVKMPGPPGNICIDSKFPLEAWKSFTEGKNEDERTISLRKLNGNESLLVD